MNSENKVLHFQIQRRSSDGKFCYKNIQNSSLAEFIGTLVTNGELKSHCDHPSAFAPIFPTGNGKIKDPEYVESTASLNEEELLLLQC